MLMKRVTAMKETSYNVEAKGSETIHIENEVCSRISLRLYIKGGSSEKGVGADHCCVSQFSAPISILKPNNIILTKI